MSNPCQIESLPGKSSAAHELLQPAIYCGDNFGINTRPEALIWGSAALENRRVLVSVSILLLVSGQSVGQAAFKVTRLAFYDAKS